MAAARRSLLQPEPHPHGHRLCAPPLRAHRGGARRSGAAHDESAEILRLKPMADENDYLEQQLRKVRRRARSLMPVVHNIPLRPAGDVTETADGGFTLSGAD